MPPKKADKSSEKPAKKLNEDEGEAVLLEYLKQQNRPYNSTDLQANLKTKYNLSKPAITKALSALASRGDIVEKLYGKQTIYGPKQPEEAGDADDPEILRSEVEELRSKTAQLNELLKATRAEIATVESAPSTTDLPVSISALESQIAAKTEHLVTLRDNPSVMLNKSDIATIDLSFASTRKIWLVRRKAGKEMQDMLTDGADKKGAAAREWLEEDVGIEFDGTDMEEMAKPSYGLPPKGTKRKSESPHDRR